MSRRRPSRDDELVGRAARRIGIQAAVLVWASFAVCASLLSVLVLRSQHAATASTLRSAVESADDVTDPPAGTWLAVQGPDGRFSVTPGAPSFLPYRAAGVVPGEASTVDLHTPQGEYRIRTEQREGRVVQAAASLAAEHAERSRLAEALAVAGGLAVLVAGALGLAAGRRWVSPLADALARQRAFVADASHELRTPLTRLTTRAQLVQRDLDRGANDRARAEATTLVGDGRRLSAVLEDLLAAAEPSAAATWELVDLDDVAESAVAAARIGLDEPSIHIAYDRGRRPVPGDPVVVRAPRPALERAVSALLDNAVRHTPGTGTVGVTVWADRRWATLVVADTGPGIPPEQQPHVFDRFSHGADEPADGESGHGETRPRRGTGDRGRRRRSAPAVRPRAGAGGGHRPAARRGYLVHHRRAGDPDGSPVAARRRRGACGGGLNAGPLSLF